MSTRQPSLLRKAISVLASFALAVAFVPIAWADMTTCTLQFREADLADLTLHYKVVPADETGSALDADVDGYGASAGIVQVSNIQVGSTVTITVTTNQNTTTQLNEFVSNVWAMEGTEEGAKSPATYISFTVDTNSMVGTYSFTASQSCVYPIYVEYVGGNPGSTGPGNTQPSQSGQEGFLSFDVHPAENGIANSGTLSYVIAESVGENTTWNTVSPEGDGYAPVKISDADSSKDSLFLKIKAASGQMLDLDRGIQFFGTERSKPIYVIKGVFNDDENDPDYSKQLGNKGLGELLDAASGAYIIPVKLDADAISSLRCMEFGWVNTMTINIAVAGADQYMLSGGKATMGIGTGKGFSVDVSKSGAVTLPILPDKDLNGDEERYLVELKLQPQYIVPEFSFNGHSFSTYDSMGNTDEYTTVAAAIPASEFKELLNESTVTIHLTVDKVVKVDMEGEGNNGPGINASFNLIDNGSVSAENSTVEALDGKNVTLDAADVSSQGEPLDGQHSAYEINMKVGEATESKFDTPISISVPGDFDPQKTYKVVREHTEDGVTTNDDLDAVVTERGDGERKDTFLTFSSDKFSRYTIVDASKASSSVPSTGGGSYVPAPQPQEPPISNAGSGDSASATVDVTDKVTTTETGSTQVAVDADLGTKIVENAVANKVADVVIKAETTAGASTETAVALPASTVKELAEKTEASVTISTDSAQVTLDKAAVAAVAEQAGEAGSVQLVVQTSEQNKNKVQIEVTLQTSNGNVSDFRGGNVTISVPVSEELAAKKIVCVYIDANGKYTKMPGALSADGKSYVFSTGHFSTYAVMTEEEANAAIAEQEKAEAAALAAAKPAAPSVKLSSPAKGKLTVKASAKKAKGYRVYYKKTGWKAYKAYTTSGTVKALSKTFKKLSKGSYTVKVRAFGKTAAGKIAWGAKSKAKKVSVK